VGNIRKDMPTVQGWFKPNRVRACKSLAFTSRAWRQEQ
jgi:hypothetical protein